MTFKTKTTVLSLLIAAFVLLLLLGTVFEPGRGAREEPVLAALKVGNLKEIAFTVKGETLPLKKEASGEWRVTPGKGSYPAAEEKVKRFMEILGEGRLSGTVTEKEDNWKSFNVGDDAERRILFQGDQGQAELILGKPTGLGTAEYVRLAGDKRVFVLSQGLSYYADQKAQAWYELRIFPKNLEGKNLVALTAKGFREKNGVKEASDYRLLREKDEQGALKWLAADEKTRRFKQTAVENLAGALAAIKGNDFTDAREGPAGIDDKPELLLEFTGQDQRNYKLALWKKAGEKQWFCLAAIDGAPLPYKYLVSEYSYDRIAPSVKSLTD